MPDDCIYFAPVRNTMTQIPGIRQERYRPSISDSQMRTDTIFVPVLSRGLMPGSADGGQKNRRRGGWPWPGAGGRGPPDRRQVKKRQRAGPSPWPQAPSPSASPAAARPPQAGPPHPAAKNALQETIRTTRIAGGLLWPCKGLLPAAPKDAGFHAVQAQCPCRLGYPLKGS